ncbi:CheR family methyltransferase [Achromobacter sp. NPDC058515]|uniref:CheR family methyltransferase n=1 Tax=Achromobacter sp. NPDC058515 TaxID=3346533 RepID=UPI0036488287
MGASAGGLDAFRAFFRTMPTDTGMSFVLVQHLDPERASALPEIIGACTPMPVTLAKTGDALAPNHVFVIPPDSLMTLSEGVLQVVRAPSATARRASVNAFLVSLAEDQGEKAVGIILSGFGSDGARGVEAIREHGGLTLAQAEFDHSPKTGMPQSAALGGFVDHVLPVEQMPAALLEHWAYRLKVHSSKGPDGVHKDVAHQLGAICAVLNSRLGRDFSQYKSNTMMRRIQRRMQVLQSESVTDYVEQLRQRPDEPELLFREVLIRVTRFFRDSGAFASLADKIPGILTSDEGQDTRVWVAGCATGEEAYTLAILFKEAMSRADRPRKVQIFASDIDDKALEIARDGFYGASIAADIPAPLLDRYFVRENDGYRVAKDIREMCLFSTHDLVKDPPFSRLSLISCRNLMIYFAPALQKRAMAMFHYALRPHGLLFLGTSEAITTHSTLFSAIDKKHRIFGRRAVPTQLPLSSAAPSIATRPKGAQSTHDLEIDPQVARIMSKYTPAFVVIDSRQNILRLSGQIGKYLVPSDGAMSMNFLTLAHVDLRAPLRAAIKQVTSTQRSVISEGIVLEVGGRAEAVTVAVEPLDNRPGFASDGLVVVAFRDHGPARTVEQGDNDEAARIELANAREHLQTLTELLETSNEELQSSNEEYQSVNEELQSTNEELETSKEELQSINEELTTLNSELNARNDSLVELNSDLTNLIDSTSIATLFLDSDLRIRRFTPAVLSIFRVREGDQGRPINDIVSRLAEDGLHSDAAQVLRTLLPVQREVGLATGDRSFQMDIRPYRGVNKVISGVVITFVDITDRERAERARASLAAIIDSSDDAIIGHDLDGVITSWNIAAEKMFGYSEHEALNRNITFLAPPGEREHEHELLERVRRGARVEHYETMRLRKDLRPVEVSQSLSPVRNSMGTIMGAARIVRELTKSRQADREKSLLLRELDHRVKNILATVSSIVNQTLKTAATPEDFAASLEGRIMALARAHNLLTQDGSGAGGLETIVQTELAPYHDDAGRVTLAGPPVILTPKAGLALAMAIHELATNAAKYGALSTSDGRLTVCWQVVTCAEGPSLRIDWREEGGPAIKSPPKPGFGTTLIERVLAFEFDAKVERSFAHEGLTCVFDLPWSHEVGYLAPWPNTSEGAS